MDLFKCGQCGERLFFENNRCLACGTEAGFDWEVCRLVAIKPSSDRLWQAAGDSSRRYRKCFNHEVEGVCNGLVPADSSDRFCVSCRLNQTIPDLSVGKNRELWGKLEAAKRRLVFTLSELGLPLIPKSVDFQRGLAFAFLADPNPDFIEGDRVLTGHSQGVITINLAEADDAVREQMRLDLREVYRTVLGHFRHEVGHYYWDLLVRNDPEIGRVRAIFGDERLNYAQALQDHYVNGAPWDWQMHFVTPYAASHPWEDWAETWAHYLHIIDTLETANAHGVNVQEARHVCSVRDPIGLKMEAILEDWHILRIVLNSLNRSMGHADAYPFVISGAVAHKLRFIHDWIRSRC
ncbi:MAG: putative zinc-binding peptidase [Opitutales bacterium]|nr:putative zinc-binding peptidase [Opitutales bacterium]